MCRSHCGPDRPPALSLQAMSLCRFDVGGQLDIVKARRCDTAFDGPLHHVSVVLQPVVTGFVRSSADVFTVIDGFAAVFALTKLELPAAG